MSDITAAGTLEFTGLGTVTRLGFGAMRLTGPGIWGEPADAETARAVARRAVDLGVDFIDTADSYGPEVSERILAEALHPYPPGLRIATKAGQVRTGPNKWIPVGRAEYLRQQAELSLRRLRVEALDVFQLHRIDPKVELAEQFGVMAELLAEGKVRSLGLSEVSVEEIRIAQTYFPVSSVQNRYSLVQRGSEGVLDHCTDHGIAFIPWAPLDAGRLAAPGGAVDAVATRLGVTHSQVALAWLLQRSPMMLPIPGTGSVAHLEENVAAAGVILDDAALVPLDAAS
ncbi:aldo/keto reductase [Pseudactinotalea sp. HY158]|uniref:aldo/keto reductase n=1 Tax=Pseudactinotalea sp. HY158 TaxID=2654547 RepID=UPI00129C7FDE|nr:aldo/keto reductase [Pseudactinotalea sp. HY158]QGH69745.1 oxidoreductase [Pseudactinotalea sp. HY158]